MVNKVLKLMTIITIFLFIVACVGCSSSGLSSNRLHSEITQSLADIQEVNKIDVNLENDGGSKKVLVTLYIKKISGYANNSSNVIKAAKNTFKSCFKNDKSLKKVEIKVYSTSMDKYGNEIPSYLATFKMSGQTANKINWDNYDKLKFNEIVDEISWDKEYLAKEKEEEKEWMQYIDKKLKDRVVKTK
ncbi:hypothetical protein [Anaerovibrio lipolyticus]|uniref:hypothetical protein n=1 Tax=Anaerovibrio lipolyticus TaxID=82374 RepID=UPI00048131EA|nr:hypothetical protein [Anaerovibrio lipolyticus]